MKMHKKLILAAATLLVVGGGASAILISSKSKGNDVNQATNNNQPVDNGKQPSTATETVAATDNTTVSPSAQTQPTSNQPPQQQEIPAPIYGEDPDNPGKFIVFDKTEVMSQAGIPASDQVDADKVITQMSNWTYKWAQYGRTSICWKVDSSLTAGTDFDSNPVTQFKFCKDRVDQEFGGSWIAVFDGLNKPH